MLKQKPIRKGKIMREEDRITPEEIDKDQEDIKTKVKASIVANKYYWEMLGKYAKDQKSNKSVLLAGLVECFFGILAMDDQGEKAFEGASFTHVINTIIHRTTGSDMMTWKPDTIEESEK